MSATPTQATTAVNANSPNDRRPVPVKLVLLGKHLQICRFL